MKETLPGKKTVQVDQNSSPRVIASFVSSVFNPYTLIRILLIAGLAIFYLQVFGQAAAKDYRTVITERAGKIVNDLGITDSNKFNEVLGDIVNQYSQLNVIDEEAKASVAAIRTQSLSKEETDKALKDQEEKKTAQLKQLHATFLTQLEKNLAAEQIEKVKDGMTYRVCPITYAAYLEMLPNLTTEQKEKIHGWLKEARELAMDEGSSEKKHAVFGKYKGKINNYLSAAGYDMKKEGEEWQKRIKEQEAKTKEQKNP